MAEPVFDREHYLEDELRKVVGRLSPGSRCARVRRWLLLALAAETTAVALWVLLASESSPARPNPPKAPPKPPVSIQLLPPVSR
ncbi:MAG: hypothetical protein IPL06_18605 [Betaproteobacteria bacterium]|nr:hypothetical protein [Betaproteobacteria bacterium]